MRITILILFTLYVVSCKDSSTDNLNNKTHSTQNSGQPIYPPLDAGDIGKMMAQVDAIDYIFHNWSFTISQDTPRDARSSLSSISKQPVYSLDCPSLGRIFIKAQGEVIAEAEIHFRDKNCAAFVFYDKNTPINANAMTAEGVEFFDLLIKRAMQANG